MPHADGVLFDGEADLLPLSWWVAQSQISYDPGQGMTDFSHLQIAPTPEERGSEDGDAKPGDIIVE